MKSFLFIDFKTDLILMVINFISIHQITITYPVIKLLKIKKFVIIMFNKYNTPAKPILLILIGLFIKTIFIHICLTIINPINLQ